MEPEGLQEPSFNHVYMKSEVQILFGKLKGRDNFVIVGINGKDSNGSYRNRV
jgi:hypothetical protein